MADKPKRKKAKAEAKLEVVAPVTQFKIPTRYIWGESPLEIASNADAPKTLKALTPDTHLEGTVIGDFVVVRNDGCDETFILHKDVVKELAEQAGV